MNDEDNENKVSSISKSRTLEEMADFWDSHSLDDYWDQTREVDIEVRATRRRRVIIEPELYQRLENQARARGILPETLINLWLAERQETGS